MGSLPNLQMWKAHETTQNSQTGRAMDGCAGVWHPAARACRTAVTAQAAVTAAPRPVAYA